MNENKEKDVGHFVGLGLSDDQRFQVLMAQMNERYQAWHHMRARSMQFTLWILGLAVAASWKLLQEPCSGAPQRIAATVLVFLLGCAATYFLTSLARGVRTNREALINVETALHAHDHGSYLSDKAILPNEYKDARPRASSHFLTLYTLLAVTCIYLLAAVWFPTCPVPEGNQVLIKDMCPCRRGVPISTLATTNTTNHSEVKGPTK